MRRLALSKSVPDSAIILDENGLTTDASIRNAAGILSDPAHRRILAVSHGWHLPRIKLRCQCEGLTAYTVPADERGQRLRRTPFLVAREVAKKFPDALVLGADTLVYLGGKLMGKPADMEEAYWMLKQLQGRTHEVVTGVCLIHLRGHRQKIFAESTSVRFHPLSTEQIHDYLVRIDPLDKAGAYAIQEHGDKIVDDISGSYSNVVGLPLERLRAELVSWEETELEP